MRGSDTEHHALIVVNTKGEPRLDTLNHGWWSEKFCVLAISDYKWNTAKPKAAELILDCSPPAKDGRAPASRPAIEGAVGNCKYIVYNQNW